jgi:O-Antigen ligase
MFYALKPLVVVLAMAAIVFALAKPICLRFIAPDDLLRRRNVWFGLTTTAFLAPNFWVYACIALVVVYVAGRKDRHPTALYAFVLLTVPPGGLYVPLPLVNQFFELTVYRVLALALLLPAALRYGHEGASRSPGLARVDAFVLAFGLLQLVLYMPYESVTNTMRRAFLFLLDIFLLYYVFSRGTVRKAALADTLASFTLACIVLVPITTFEALKGWLLYTGIPSGWGVPNEFSWLTRGDSLRAQAAAGHSLTMGFFFAMALGAWLYLGSRVESKKLLWGVGIALWAGLFATYSRSPWVVAVAVMFAYMLLSPTGRRALPKATLALAALVVPLSFTSFGQKIVAILPFVGTSDQNTVDYRTQVATVSWRLIQQNPLFGNPFALAQMGELRQGQGIIDLMNAYTTVALFYGLVGAAMFVACFLYPLMRSGMAWHAASAAQRTDDANLGAGLLACLVGVMLMMATSFFGSGFEICGWMLTGMCCAYPAIVRQSLAATSTTRASAAVPAAAVRPVPAAGLGPYARVRRL